MPPHGVVMTDSTQIRSVHWQMRRDPDGVAVIGAVFEGLADLDAEIRQCILTPKGSVPFNPAKGCDLQRFRDRSMNALHLFAAAEVAEALSLWCPRITVHSVAVEPSIDQLTIAVIWTPTQAVMTDIQRTEVVHVW